MKKTYISPELLVIKIGCRAFVATSSFDKYDTGADGGVVLVKENNSGSSSGSVWDDEW